MVGIETFEVEKWMDDHETTAKYNLAETCCSSISVEQLQGFCEDKTKNIFESVKTKRLDYGAIRGSEALRGNLSRLYSSKAGSPLPADNILITSGAINANFLLYYSLIGPGDHVICHYPTYQQLYSVPASLGAEVSLWKSSPEKDWKLDISELQSLIKPNTKIITINNPQNPTGAVLGRSQLQQIVDIAAEKDIIVFADEVYRPIFHGITPADSDFPPSIVSMGYKKTIATGSLTKAYALAGIRVGWVASRDREIIEIIANVRQYTTISVGQIDEAIAAFALDQSAIHNLLGRNIQLAKTNLELLERWIIKHDDTCEWVKPRAGTTAFVRFHREGQPIDATAFCQTLQDKTGVMFVPGDTCFGGGKDFRGYVRIGYVNETDLIKEGLEKARVFMKKEFDDIPLAS